VVSRTFLSTNGSVKLVPARSPQAILRLTVRARAPERGCVSCVLRYENGLRVSETNSVVDEVLAFGKYSPKLGELTFTLCAENLGGLRIPGDANQDGLLDLSDAIWLLGHLFLGTEPSLPCDGGTASSPGPGALALVDVNGDGGIDLSDGVSILGFLFLGGDPPALGTECTRMIGCSDLCPE
jgi:hypothetical protein